MIENLMDEHDRAEREVELLNVCFDYLAEALSKQDMLRVIRDKIGLTHEEIEKYQMEWLLEDLGDGEKKV